MATVDSVSYTDPKTKKEETLAVYGGHDANTGMPAWLGSSGGSGGGSSNPYTQVISDAQSRYDDLNRQIAEKNRLAVNQGVNRLNNQKTNINQGFDDNAQQAYIQYMKAQQVLPQQLAAQGIKGGATETANLGLQTGYQNNLTNINNGRQKSLQDIDNAVLDLQNSGDLASADQVLSNNQAALQAYLSLFNNQVGYNQWSDEFNTNKANTEWEQGYKNKSYEDMLKQQAYENGITDQQLALEKQRLALQRSSSNNNPGTLSLLQQLGYGLDGNGNVIPIKQEPKQTYSAPIGPQPFTSDLILTPTSKYTNSWKQSGFLY